MGKKDHHLQWQKNNNNNREEKNAEEIQKTII